MTTTRITHATPAAAYAHSPERNWEADISTPDTDGTCKDIALQLIEKKKIQVHITPLFRKLLLKYIAVMSFAFMLWSESGGISQLGMYKRPQKTNLRLIPPRSISFGKCRKYPENGVSHY